MSEAPPVGGDELTARAGELRRLTILFCDVVGSTELSGRWEPETYRELMSGYRSACREVIESDFEGHIVHIKGDGILAVFGFPVAHENDTERAVRAGLELVRAVRRLSAHDMKDESLRIRVAVHHGPLYVDLDEDDVYGLAANVGARLQTIAEPGTVILSDEVRELVGDRFEIEPGDPQIVKGVPDPLRPFRVIGERRAPVVRPWATPLIERDAELERLRQAWARVSVGTAGHCGGVLISGEAGVGKSRLLAAFVDEAASSGAGLLELQGSPFHTDVGFHPVRSLIEYRCGMAVDADPATRLKHLAGEVSSLGLDSRGALPLLAPLMGIAPAAGYEPVAVEGQLLLEQIATAARGYIDACAAEGPTVIVAENLHWFDDATRALLMALVEDQPHGVLVIGTSRQSEDGSWEAIDLQPLTQPGRLELIDALQEGIAEEDRVALAARSGGIPLYLEELVRAGPNYRPIADDAVPVPGSVPAALYEPLVARLYATPTALPLAAAAAAAGQEVDRSLLAATMTLPAGELDTALQALLDAQILEPVAKRRDRYQFRHELLREVAYELRPPSWRHLYVAVSRFMASDLTGADASLAEARGVSEPQDFPQGPWSIDYVLWFASWMWTESGRLDDAHAAIEELCTSSASHGFAGWQLIGATQAATLEAIVTLRSGHSGDAALAAHANGLSGFIELWKALGLHAFLPFYLTTCGALLAASGDPDGARQRYEESLEFAAQTGMRFYDAETARRLAHLALEPEAKAAALGDALELARSQGARPFELRIALDLHDALGEDARPQLELAMAAFPEDAMTIDLEKARSRISAPG